MKIIVQKKIIIFATLFLLLFPVNVLGEDNSTISSIEIDRHWIYIYQQDDFDTFEINEYFFINNTGDTNFNESFYMWIQNNSIIGTDCCDYNPNMACRYNELGIGECFYLNKTENNNVFIGSPFFNGSKLSYYGQKESFSITAIPLNSTLKSSILNFNATIGANSIPREQKNFQGIGVHFTSENLDIGMLPVINPFMPYNITSIENITIFNNGSNTEIIDFLISDLLEGWTAEIWNSTGKINNITLSPQENLNLSLILKAPSHLASIYVRYISDIGSIADESKGTFLKKYLYDTKKITYEVYLLNDAGLEISNDLTIVHNELFWLEDYNRFWLLAKADNIESNSNSMITFNLIETTTNNLDLFIIFLLVLILIFILFILLYNKIDFFKKKNTLQKKESSKEKDKSRPVKENRENRLKALEVKKKEIISSIKRVDREYKDGILNTKDYESFRNAYKKKAVDILKEIDKLKE